jgi:AraC-like DNA-binding protein
MELLEQLKARARAFPEDPADAISVRRIASAAVFSSRKVDWFGDVTPPRPLIAVVLDGQKDVVHAGTRTVLDEGDVLVAPAGVTYRATTVPSRRTRRYRVFCAELAPEAAAAFARAYPRLCATPALGAFEADRPHVVRAERATLRALLHFADTLLEGEAPHELVQHRLEDLLLSLSLQHGAAPRAANGDVVLAARHVVRSAPDRAWPAPAVAKALSMSPATLRRRLRAHGATLSTLRAEERMALAAVLMAQPDARVGEVAARCGYGSPSKFARQYRKWFGRAPRRS